MAEHLLMLTYMGLTLVPLLYIFCELNQETNEHIIWNYNKVRECQNLVALHIGVDLSLIQEFVNVEWLSNYFHSMICDKNFKSFSPFFAWNIWTTRCNYVLKNWELDFHKTFIRPYNKQMLTLGLKVNIKESFLGTFVYHSISIFSNASWVGEGYYSGLVFVIIVGSNQIILVRSDVMIVETLLQTELEPQPRQNMLALCMHWKKRMIM